MWGNSPKDYAKFCKKKPRKISEKYLNLLHQKGRVAKPLSSSEIIEIIKNNGMSITQKNEKGGMRYLSGKKSQSNN
jgi:DNA-binding TFAR19-related protein (PDSD5 family)